MAIAEKMEIMGINAKLAIGAAQVLLEEMTALTFLTNDADKGVDSRLMKGKWHAKVGVGRNPIVYRVAMGEAEIDDNARFSRAAVCDLKRGGYNVDAEGI